jgi:hypothetical protein
MASFDDFKLLAERFGWMAGLAAAGATFAPLITAAAGFAPPWPESLPFLTSVFMLVAMMLCFALVRGVSAAKFRRLLITFALLFTVVIGGYLYAFDMFVYDNPDTGTKMSIGCEWTRDAKLLAKARDLDLESECPGPFEDVLHEASADSDAIWTTHSQRNVRFGLLGLWIASFGALTVLIAAFLLSLKDKAGAKRAEEKKQAAG